MGDSRTNFDENSSSKSYTQLTLPQLPQEDNILSHAATKWIEEAETAIIARGLLPIIAEPPELPLAARIIIDTPLVVLPSGTVLSLRDQQLRMSIETENKRNKMKREKILLLKRFGGMFACISDVSDVPYVQLGVREKRTRAREAATAMDVLQSQHGRDPTLSHRHRDGGAYTCPGIRSAPRDARPAHQLCWPSHERCNGQRSRNV